MFVPCHMINDGGEVGGPVQLNRLEALVVSFENPLDAVTVRVLDVAILEGGKKTNTRELTEKKLEFYQV